MEPRLDITRTYAAIIEAARARRFLTYVDVAQASGVPWSKARYPIGQHLDRMLAIAQRRGWPLLTSIVVRKDDAQTGRLTDGARTGFLQGVRRNGVEVAEEDADAFIIHEQQRTFEWASGAPDALDEPDLAAGSPSAALSPGIPESGDIDESVQYWFVGSIWGGKDQTERFIADGIWQSGYENDPLVAEIRPGDRIAIKASYVRKHDLPFDLRGRKVAAMKIKAVGTVTENLGDGVTVRVDWSPLDEPREWYFYTYRVALVRADPANPSARRLIDFAFQGAAQDYAYWLRLPYFTQKYLWADAEPANEAAEEEDEASPYSIDHIVEEGCFVPRDDLERALDRLHEKKNLILQGPPGTGKTWLAKRLGYALLRTDDLRVVRQRMRVVQFHPTLSYEDFVRGWRPGPNGTLQLVDGLFLQAVQAAKAGGDPFVFVIEEINRGNPAQIFGELLTLLEASKRNEKDALELGYRNADGPDPIYLPDNLYLIGTMNLADRSLAMVDVALRRRFAFVSLTPSFGPLWRDWCISVGGLPASAVDAIERGMRAVNQSIAEDAALGPQYCVGHSYFTPMARIAEEAASWFGRVVGTEIEPLLAEYWYDNPSRLQAALADLRSPWR